MGDCPELFTPQHIIDTLKSTFSYSGASEISISLDNCKKILLLTVEKDGLKQKYVLMKISENLKTKDGPQKTKSKVLYPEFILKTEKEECYGAYEHQHGMAHFETPKSNDVEHLKIILQNLAEHQASELVDGDKIESTSEYNLAPITHPITSLEFFKDINAEIIKQSIEELQLALNKLLKNCSLLVRSVGCPFAKNIIVNHAKSKSIFFNVSSTKITPPSYDALLYIFALSDEKFRQKHFETLILYYFKSLTESLETIGSDLAKKVTNDDSEHAVKVLLPVIKFELVASLLKVKKSSDLQDILTNILYFLKYPLINQEDIYETVKTKIGSSDYDILDYSLIALDEKNGHLGEYFNLNIKIKANNKENTLELFAKILKNSSEMLDQFVKSGPAKKEDFIYKTFIPLCAQNGLESILDFAPKCFLSRINWLLVLDDLSRQGYKGFKPNSVLNYDGLRASIVKLANFHACSIILEEIISKESGKLFRLDQDYSTHFREHMYIYEEGHHLKRRHDKTIDLFYFILEKFPEITKKLNGPSEELRTRFKKMFMATFSKIKKSNIMRNVINHGDMYVANILFKSDENNLITQSMLIDFQLLRYIPPTYELSFFIFENSTKETRDKYFEILIEEYYQCISENIRKFNFDPEEVFPKKLFDENIIFMRSAAIIGALNYAYMVHIDPDLREEIFHDPLKFDHYLHRHPEDLINLSLEIDQYKTILRGFAEDIIDIINNEF